jgi:hypothetical protein
MLKIIKLFKFSKFQIGNKTIPKTERYKIAVLRSRQLRAEEEKSIVIQEMSSMLDNLGQQHAVIIGLIDGDYSAGIKNALLEHLEMAGIFYFRARKIFTKWLPVLPDVPENLWSVNVEAVIDRIVDDSILDMASSDDDLVSDDDDDDMDEDFL